MSPHTIQPQRSQVQVRRTTITAAEIVAALGGSNGRCACPAHGGSNPTTLSVIDGHTVPIVVKCFAGCPTTDVIEALVARGLWPDSTKTHAPSISQRRSDEDRRQYALKILADTRDNRGEELVKLALTGYFRNRGITSVPPTALFAHNSDMDSLILGRAILVPDDPAMIFPVTDGKRIIGCHVTWLSDDWSTKRPKHFQPYDPRKVYYDPNIDGYRYIGELPPAIEQPQRQFYGPIRGGYIKLYDGEHPRKSKLIISEGIETAASAMQMTGLPGIAALSATNMTEITPPLASEYHVYGDNDTNGAGQRAAWALGRRLRRAGHVVWVFIPKRPDSDWNDYLQEQETTER